MLRNFFAAPSFLALLRFWESQRMEHAVPRWNGDLSRIPAGLLSRLVIVDCGRVLTYRYLGAENVKQFGRDPTGSTVNETLSPEYATYITELITSALDRRAPIFSASVLHHDTSVKLTGRLVAPFAIRDAAAPNLIMSAHLVGGDDFKVTEIREPGSIVETERLMIAGVPAVCARLEEAERYHRLSHLASDRRLAGEWDEIAASLGAGVFITLGRFGAVPTRP